jgi:hypothetical protein
LFNRVSESPKTLKLKNYVVFVSVGQLAERALAILYCSTAALLRLRR